MQRMNLSNFAPIRTIRCSRPIPVLLRGSHLVAAGWHSNETRQTSCYTMPSLPPEALFTSPFFLLTYVRFIHRPKRLAFGGSMICAPFQGPDHISVFRELGRVAYVAFPTFFMYTANIFHITVYYTVTFQCSHKSSQPQRASACFLAMSKVLLGIVIPTPCERHCPFRKVEKRGATVPCKWSPLNHLFQNPDTHGRRVNVVWNEWMSLTRCSSPSYATLFPSVLMKN
jgi:hypothetical protein